ncbi:unnamed protein product [Chrysoparadoxa australica]
MTPISLGQRVKDSNGFAATVRYIGPVSTSKDPSAVWIGVEFDDPTRGKHQGPAVTAGEDGAEVYFHCQGGGSGSFLKPDKVDTGISLVQALAQHYVELDAPLEAPGNVFEGSYAQTAKGGRKPIEFYGESKIRARQQVGELEHITLRGMGVASAGETEALAAAAGHFSQVDLTGNLLSSWVDVCSIAQQLPLLEVLNLTGNKLRAMAPNSIPPAMSPLTYPKLRTLVLNSCSLKGFSQVAQLVPNMPQLKELYLADNDLSDLEMCSSLEGLAGLHVLDVSECRICEWSQVAAFGSLPTLEVLSLNHNPLEAVTMEAGGAPQAFPSLHTVSLVGTKISSWHSVEQVGELPALTNLRFAACPLSSQMSSTEARAIILGRLPKLRRVNGSDVSSKERVEAEKTYLRMVLREMKGREEGEQLVSEIRQVHPRYNALLALYGDCVRPGVASNGGTGTLASDMISVSLCSMASGSCTAEPTCKKLPGSLPIKRLKVLCKQLFKLDIDLQVKLLARNA